MLDVSSNRRVESASVSWENSGSSWYWGSSRRRVVVGCASRDGRRSKDILGSESKQGEGAKAAHAVDSPSQRFKSVAKKSSGRIVGAWMEL